MLRHIYADSYNVDVWILSNRSRIVVRCNTAQGVCLCRRLGRGLRAISESRDLVFRSSLEVWEMRLRCPGAAMTLAVPCARHSFYSWLFHEPFCRETNESHTLRRFCHSDIDLVSFVLLYSERFGPNGAAITLHCTRCKVEGDEYRQPL